MARLAIDQGTTSTRALLMDDSGRSRITRVMGHRQIYPQPGWVEHDPEEIITSIQDCLSVDEKIEAIGFDNQGESCLAWDAMTKRAISPIIVWQDNRTRASTEKLVADGAEKMVQERAGLPLDAYFSASKLAWILQNIPAAARAFEKGRLRLGTTDAFFLDRLANRFVTDITTASRTSLMNLETGEWDSGLCELFGVPIGTLPEIVPTIGDFGCIHLHGKSIPVTASIVDQQASLYGHGCRKPGDAKITFGTGAFALAITGDRICRAPERGLLPTVAWQIADRSPVYALDGGVYCAGSAINWVKSLGLFNDYEQINNIAQASAIQRNLVFVPALAGLACPHWDRRAAGMWLGMCLDTSSLDLVQAVLEGIAFRAAEVLTAMSDFVPIQNAISIDGGLSLNPYFCQFLANVLEREVKVQRSAELTALGTAMLAGNIESTEIQSPGEIKIFSPTANLSQHIERYAQAVTRCRKWLL